MDASKKPSICYHSVLILTRFSGGGGERMLSEVEREEIHADQRTSYMTKLTVSVTCDRLVPNVEKWNKNRTSMSLKHSVPLCPSSHVWYVPTEKLPANVKNVTYSDLTVCTQRCGVLQQLVWTCTYVQPLLCCNYLQAVPCDPAGADFNFAALSFNSEFLHQIHLIPLHGCSPAEKQTIFRLSAAENVARDLKERRLAGWKETGTILITTFLLVCLVMRCDLRHSLGRPTLAACPPSHLSHENSLCIGFLSCDVQKPCVQLH